MEDKETITTLEDLQHAKKALEEEIKAHKLDAVRHRDQIKMFMRQGVGDLPEKQQNIHQKLEEKEQELQERLKKLAQLSKQLNPEEEL